MSEPEPTLPTDTTLSTDTREGRIAAAYAHMARLEARHARAELAPRRVRRSNGSSIVYSIRLDPEEVAALEDKASLIGIKPTVLARNLIRTGLTTRARSEVVDVVDRLSAVVEELRGVVVS